MSANFIVVDHLQGTESWREWRAQGIGASEAPIIMGESRFKTWSQLLEEKRGPVRDFGQNAAMAMGTRLEPEARERYIAKTGRKVFPICIQSTRIEWLRASLDGLSPDGQAAVEIKCGRAAYWSAAKTRRVSKDYYGQLQQIMAVTNLRSLDYWCCWPGFPAILIPVERNDNYIDRLLQKGAEFWSAVKRT